MKRKHNDRISSFFGPDRIVVSGSAPGRLDVMGGVADYSGSLVLEYPIAESTRAYVALRNDRIFRVQTDSIPVASGVNEVEVRLPKRFSYRTVTNLFPNESRWAAYVVGCAAVLERNVGVPITGADILIESDVPAGRGVSASAALEVATMAAFCNAYDVKLEDTQLPVLCQLVENVIVGAPCGLMDQTASYLGRKDALLPILCQPQTVRSPIPLPEGIYVVGIDSQVSHSVSGSAYSDARTAAFMGYEIIRKHLRQSRPFSGYLANISPHEFNEEFRRLLPERLTGRSFLRRYERTIDAVTSVKSRKTYAIRDSTAHPVYENARVHRFVDALRQINKQVGRKRRSMIAEVGSLMYQSHDAYSTIGLGHPTTDQIVVAARSAGPSQNVFGARVTGGGSGGTVCLLVAGKKGLRAAKKIAKQCTGSTRLFAQSSEGARWRRENKRR